MRPTRTRGANASGDADTPGAQHRSAEGTRILDDLADAFRDGLFFNTEIDTCMEEWGCEDPGADAADSTLDGPMCELASSARTQHASNYTAVPNANVCNGDLLDSPEAIADSDATGAIFLADMVTFTETETPEGLLQAMRAYTEWIDTRDDRTQGLYVGYSNRVRGINRELSSEDEETQILMAKLWTSSRAYYWYVKCSMIVGCGVDGRVPSFDMGLLTGAVALWFMVSCYAPWAQQRRAYANRPPICGAFALCILGRLMSSILEQSEVEFEVCLVDILCNFPGLPIHVDLCQHQPTVYVDSMNPLQ